MYNAEATIQRCLDSLVSQAGVGKIIVVDDASVDCSMQLADQYMVRFSHVVLKPVVHGGPSRARNEGLKYAESPVVMFCDADDYYLPNMVSSLLTALEKTNADLAVGGIVDIDGQGRTRCRKCSEQQITDKLYASELILMDPSVFGNVCNKAYRRNKLQGLLFDDRYSFCEDTIFNLTFIEQSVSKMVMVNQPLYAMCYNAQSLTNSGRFDAKGMNAAQNLENYACEHHVSDQLKKIIEAKCFALRAFSGEKGLIKEFRRDFFATGTACHNYFFNKLVPAREKIYTALAILRTK